MSEWLIRDWFGEQLITTQRVRRPILRHEAAAFGLTYECLRSLSDSFLIRHESRSGRELYELAHDRLIKPVLDDNEAWRAEHLYEFLFHHRAKRWVELNRPSDPLVTGTMLEEEERWAKDHDAELTKDEQDFLQAYQEQRDRQERWHLTLTSHYLAAQALLLLQKEHGEDDERAALLARQAYLFNRQSRRKGWGARRGAGGSSPGILTSIRYSSKY